MTNLPKLNNLFNYKKESNKKITAIVVQGNESISKRNKRGSGLEMTHFFNNKQVLMENVSFQDLTPKLFFEDKFYLSKEYLEGAKGIFIDWYKKRAYEKISERVKWYAQKRGFKYNRINITNAQKRWGSCSCRNNLNFSWWLIMAPLPVVDYVIVHELVHLDEKNHSRAFWNKVKMLMTDYKKYQEWLKKNGHLLRL